MLVFLFLVSAGLVIGQAPSPRCLPLDDKTVCGPTFKDASVLAEIFPSLSVFNDYMTNTFANAEYAAASISEGSECQVSSQNLSRLRFQVSYWCSRIVSESAQLGCATNASINSNPNAEPSLPSIRLCASSCGAARDTLISVLSDPAVCKPGDPSLVTNPFNTFCATAPSTNCFLAVPRELETCGFRTAEIATKECPSATDDCCKALVEKLNAANRSRSKADSSATVQSGAPSPIALGIAAGVCIFLIVVLFIASGILVRYYSKKDKHNNGPDSSSASPSNNSPHYDSRDRMTMYTVAMEDAPKKAPSNLYPIQEYQQGIDHNSPVSEKSFTEFHGRPLNASSIYTDYPTVKTMDLADARLENGNLTMDPHRESVLSESRMYVVSPASSPYSMPSNPSYFIPPPPAQGPQHGTEQ